MVWYLMESNVMECCGMEWYGAIKCGIAKHGIEKYACSMVWSGMFWSGEVWSGKLFVCFVCLFCCFMSQANSYGHGGTVSSPNHTFFLDKIEQEVNQYFVHILSLVTDNKPS